MKQIKIQMKYFIKMSFPTLSENILYRKSIRFIIADVIIPKLKFIIESLFFIQIKKIIISCFPRSGKLTYFSFEKMFAKHLSLYNDNFMLAVLLCKNISLKKVTSTTDNSTTQQPFLRQPSHFSE